MSYTKNDPVWSEGVAPGVSAARLNHMEEQYDEGKSDLDAHKVLNTGVHGAGASVLATAADIATHAALTIAHGAVSAATASKIAIRDASGRAKFAAPSGAGDVLVKGTRVTPDELPAMTDEKIWKGTGTNVEEIDVPDPTKELWVPVTYTTGALSAFGNFVVANMISFAAKAYMSFKCPHDFAAITSAEIITIPRVTDGAANWDISSDYGAVGEAYNTHSETDAATTYNVTISQLFNVDISGILSSLAADDYVGICLTLSDDADDLYVVGLRFRYS